MLGSEDFDFLKVFEGGGAPATSTGPAAATGGLFAGIGGGGGSSGADVFGGLLESKPTGGIAAVTGGTGMLPPPSSAPVGRPGHPGSSGVSRDSLGLGGLNVGMGGSS